MNNNGLTRGMNSQFQLNYNIVNHNMGTDDERFPEVYRVLHPVVSQLIADMENHYGNIQMSDEVLDSMTDIALQRAGLLEQSQLPAQDDDISPMPMNPVNPMNPMDGSAMPEAVPTVSFVGDRRWDRDRGRDRRWDGRWGNHSRSTLNDIARILLLQQIFGGRRPRWRW